MNGQAKTSAMPAPPASNSSSSSSGSSSRGATTTTTPNPPTFDFDGLPNDMQRQLPTFLSSYDIIAGIGTTNRGLRELCLPLVTEVRLNIPALQAAAKIVHKNGERAAWEMLPKDWDGWDHWAYQEGAKLATDLLVHLPKVRVISYEGMWSTQFQGIVGEAICRLGTWGTPLLELRDIDVRQNGSSSPHGRANHFVPRPCFKFTPVRSPLTRALEAGFLPSLVRVDSSSLGLDAMAVAHAIHDGCLLDLLELSIRVGPRVPGEALGVMEALIHAFPSLGQARGNQAMLERLEIREGDVHHGQVAQLLLSPCAQELRVLRLAYYQYNTSTASLPYLFGPEARQRQRPHLEALTLPYMPHADAFMDCIIDALAVHRVFPNLSSLGFQKLPRAAFPDLARLYEPGGFQALRELDLGYLENGDACAVEAFLHRVSETSDKGAALEVLKGSFIGEWNNFSVADAICEGLKKGAFPHLQELRLYGIFDGGNMQRLIRAMAGATPDTETCRATLRCICLDVYDPAQEAALRNVFRGDELTIVGA